MLLFFRSNQVSQYTNSRLQEPAHVIHAFRCLNILHTEYNRLLKPFVVLNFNTLILVCVICNFVIIRSKMSKHFVILQVLPVFGLTLFGTIFLFVAYTKFGQINSGSKCTLVKWKTDLK